MYWWAADGLRPSKPSGTESRGPQSALGARAAAWAGCCSQGDGGSSRRAFGLTASPPVAGDLRAQRAARARACCLLTAAHPKFQTHPVVIPMPRRSPSLSHVSGDRAIASPAAAVVVLVAFSWPGARHGPWLEFSSPAHRVSV